MSSTIAKLTEFMSEELGIDGEELNHDELLFSTGIIDSFSLVTLLSFIESEFSFRINPIEVILDNFDSLERMERFISEKLAA
jgi:acyl carrier protein